MPITFSLAQDLLQTIAMHFSIDEIKSDFVNYEIIEFEEKEIELNEGYFITEQVQ